MQSRERKEPDADENLTGEYPMGTAARYRRLYRCVSRDRVRAPNAGGMLAGLRLEDVVAPGFARDSARVLIYTRWRCRCWAKPNAVHDGLQSRCGAQARCRPREMLTSPATSTIQ